MKKLIKRTCIGVSMVFMMANPVLAHNHGLVTKPSMHSVDMTVEKLQAIITEKGLTIFTTIDHQKGAESVGLEMNESQVIIFGNPKIGSKMMNCSPELAIDLPLKFLVFEDKDQKVHIAYNSMQHLKARHNVMGCDKVLENVDGALVKMSTAASQ